VRFPFLELPTGGRVLPRPVLPVQLEDLDIGPLLCLVDTGALDNRFGAEMALAAGISLDDPLGEDEIVVGGVRTVGKCERVDLVVGDFRFQAPVWFCDPWPFAFGLLGQEGFLRFFRLTVSVAGGWLECELEPAG
jgi:hypothetical protein